MSEITEQRKPPEGLGRLAFRAPIYLYRAGLGGLLGKRFLLLNHVGRKSGLPRQAVLEVVDYDTATDTYYVASGYGRSSQWFKNIEPNPEVTIQAGWRKLAVTADILSPAESGEKMVQYAQRMPQAAEYLSKLIGLEIETTEAGYRRAGEEHIPFIAMRPKLVLDDGGRQRRNFVLILAAIAALIALKVSRGRSS